jgi:hypothetical protein
MSHEAKQGSPNHGTSGSIEVQRQSGVSKEKAVLALKRWRAETTNKSTQTFKQIT